MMQSVRSSLSQWILRGLSLAFITLILQGCGGGGGGNGGVNRNAGGPPAYTVGGTVFGLKGTLVLQNTVNNNNEDLTVKIDSGFKFTKTLSGGDNYQVTIISQPTGEQCSLINGQGTISTSNIANVDVSCYPALNLSVHSLSQAVTLNWQDQAGGTTYKLYYAPTPCNIQDIKTCSPMTTVTINNPQQTSINGANVDTYPVSKLTNKQPYYFYLEAFEPGGYQTNSYVVGGKPDTLITDSDVLASTVDSNGAVYLGGTFQRIGAQFGPMVTVDLNDGGIRGEFSPLVESDISGVSASVNVIRDDGAGGWYIGGTFDKVKGVSVHNIAHILPDGSVDSKWTPAPNGRVSDINVDGNTIYICGEFTQIGATQRNFFAALGADGSLLPFNPNPNAIVNTITVYNGIIYLAGFFSQVTDQSTKPGTQVNRTYIAALDAVTGAVLKWYPAPNANAPNTSLNFASGIAIHNNIAYVSGVFQSIDGTPRNNIAAVALDSTGTLLDWNPNATNYINTIAFDANYVYLGGTFDHVLGVAQNYIAAVTPADLTNKTPATLANWYPKLNGSVDQFSLQGTRLYIAGEFTIANGQSRNAVAAISTTQDTTLYNWDPEIQGPVAITSLQISGNMMLIGGFFNIVNGVNRNYLAALNSDGTLNNWNPNADNIVDALAADNSGDIYAGGTFSHIGTTPRQYLAKINSAGTLQNWVALLNGPVNTIAVSGNTVFIGGQFTLGGGVGNGGIAAIDASNPATFLKWQTPLDAGVINNIQSLLIDNNTLYAGGDFSVSYTDATGAVNTLKNLAAFSIDNSANPAVPFGSLLPGRLSNVTLSAFPTAANQTPPFDIHALSAYNNTLYVGGDFTATDNTSGQSQAELAALSMTDGSLQSVVPSLTTSSASYNPTVTAITQSGGNIYFGGRFTHVGSNNTSYLAAIDSTGAILNWNPVALYYPWALTVDGSNIVISGSTLSGFTITPQ